ncbi:hypothetical protein B0H16DRAFT_1459277 [Mycena metata]|uniref:Uncharacterized protein n=1 Tax=Mycena metata TaxID=1033252 RepID=A0AAD7IZE8_9AGAR|nr:hypothetical protein B0H16DRAFT_1459277 [Mycena metata]
MTNSHIVTVSGNAAELAEVRWSPPSLVNVTQQWPSAAEVSLHGIEFDGDSHGSRPATTFVVEQPLTYAPALPPARPQLEVPEIAAVIQVSESNIGQFVNNQHWRLENLRRQFLDAIIILHPPLCILQPGSSGPLAEVAIAEELKGSLKPKSATETLMRCWA